MNPLRSRLSPLVLTLAIGLTACGDDGDSSDSPEASADQTEAAAGPTLKTVLSCLQDAGLGAKDQSSNTSGETIGIDYPSGRTVISFEKSEEDAELAESVNPDPTVESFRKGLIVVSPAADPAAEADRAAIEGCL